MTPVETMVHMAEIAAALVDRPAGLRPLRIVAIELEGTENRARVTMNCRTHNGTDIAYRFWFKRGGGDVLEVHTQVVDYLGARDIPLDSAPGIAADCALTYAQKQMGIQP